jgi:GNAT superfamily N-acetyltransferase
MRYNGKNNDSQGMRPDASADTGKGPYDGDFGATLPRDRVPPKSGLICLARAASKAFLTAIRLNIVSTIGGSPTPAASAEPAKRPAIVIRPGIADNPGLHHFVSVNLSTAQIQKFESHIKNSYDGVVFDVMVARDLLVGNAIELIWIIVPDRKQGVGTAIMRELCEFADRHEAEIRLTPASKADYAATTSRARLVRFYKRFGFVTDNRMPGEVKAIPGLIRQPVI